ncbi:hypothetical protein [Streptomyces olivaceiscleroticus]|uniref:Uncharacterized protein n=1 Tax=Streptomyces olivaceiscleroticus TaxID=68245 RepID=A0ABP3JKY4_9ACTN
MEPTGTEGDDEESPRGREDRSDERKRIAREAAVNISVTVLSGVIVEVLSRLF